MDDAKREWHAGRVKDYRDRRATYSELADALREILELVARRYAPGALVQARAKSISSFAEKILRKDNYDDPLREMTDLAGVRVVAYTRSHVNAICRFIEQAPGIVIDRENSGDTRTRLGTGEFGYIAMHYVVSLVSDRILGVKIEAEVRNLRAEIQICTMLQHVWAAINHDRIYKTKVQVPEPMKREISGVAALLEACDAKFGSTIETLDAYIGDFDAYLSSEEIRGAIARWEAVHSVDDKDPEAIHSIGRLQMAAGRWADAHKWLLALKDSEKSQVLSDLGRAAWRAGFVEEGRSWLRKATVLDGANTNAHCEAGASYLATEPVEARKHYATAFALAPDDPCILTPFVECEVRIQKDASALRLLRGSLRNAIEECVRRADLGVHLPDSYFERGRLELYADPQSSYESLSSYCKALTTCEAPALASAELDAIERIATALGGAPASLADVDDLKGVEWVRRLLVLGAPVIEVRESQKRAVANEEKPTIPGPFELDKAGRAQIERIATPADKRPRFNLPVVIVAGGCDPEVQQDLQNRFGKLLKDAFAGFSGTIICGGTDAGVSGMVAELKGREIVKIGYLPDPVPSPDREHSAYRLCRTAGHDYSPLGPLQTWADLLLAGIDPADVRVVGINGGRLSAFEYRLALALGATIGIVEGSGRAASDILPDADWRTEPRLVPLPNDWATLSAFVLGKRLGSSGLSPEVLEAAAEAAHKDCRDRVLEEPGKAPAAILNWSQLPDNLKDSNRQQVAYATFNLRSAGFDVRPGGKGETLGVEPPGFDGKIEAMAEREHGRYVAERLADGWRCGEKNDAAKKTNPSIIPWMGLPDKVKQYDRDAVHRYAKLLAMAGLKIVPLTEGQ